jgi:hypothetical protein
VNVPLAVPVDEFRVADTLVGAPRCCPRVLSRGCRRGV